MRPMEALVKEFIKKLTDFQKYGLISDYFEANGKVSFKERPVYQICTFVNKANTNNLFLYDFLLINGSSRLRSIISSEDFIGVHYLHGKNEEIIFPTNFKNSMRLIDQIADNECMQFEHSFFISFNYMNDIERKELFKMLTQKSKSDEANKYPLFNINSHQSLMEDTWIQKVLNYCTSKDQSNKKQYLVYVYQVLSLEIAKGDSCYGTFERHRQSIVSSAKKLNIELQDICSGGQEKTMEKDSLQRISVEGNAPGKKSPDPIFWQKTAPQLVYLLETLKSRGFLSQADSVTGIIKTHFRNKEGKEFAAIHQVKSGLKKQKRGVQEKPVLDEIIDETSKK